MEIKRLTLDIPEDLHKAIKEDCHSSGTTMVSVIRKSLLEVYGGSQPNASFQKQASAAYNNSHFQDANMKRLTLDIPLKLHQSIKMDSALQGTSMVEQIRSVLYYIYSDSFTD